jgi:hypothetical protein
MSILHTEANNDKIKISTENAKSLHKNRVFFHFGFKAENQKAKREKFEKQPT